jgi:hypothetical protein
MSIYALFICRYICIYITMSKWRKSLQQDNLKVSVYIFIMIYICVYMYYLYVDVDIYAYISQCQNGGNRYSKTI